MPQNFDDKDLLTDFERRFTGPYKEYYLAKRNNLFASIQSFPDMWDCFMLLDRIYCREFEDMQRATELYKSFSLILFFNAHAKMRIAMELGLSACLMEAHSIVRDSIESFAHGYRIQDPNLLKIWLSRNDGPAGQKAYEEHFWHRKRETLFKGLDKLYGGWKQYSEIGSHTSINSLSERFAEHKTATDVHWMLHYTGSDTLVLATALATMLLVFSDMEEIMFQFYESRLKLDDGLHKMRADFSQKKERVRARAIKTIAGFTPPAQP